MVVLYSYKVLPSFIQVIQGDGICAATLEAILAAMAGAGWSAENVTFGSGGALLQRMDRDKLKCAYKCCMAAVNDRQVSKQLSHASVTSALAV